MENSNLKYHIQTFGCQMNYSDTERVSAVLEKAGYSPAEKLEEVDLFIFNTCSIKQKGEDRVYGIIKNIGRQKKNNPRLLIGITGCMVRKSSTRNSEKEKQDHLVRQLKPLDFVFRITDTHRLPEILAEAEPTLELPEQEIADQQSNLDYLKVTPEYSTKFQAFVPIQLGCDKYCTYCIVPYSRGREQSRPHDEILAECRELVANGCKEITLVGQTVNSYGLSAIDKTKPEFAPYYAALSAHTSGGSSTPPPQTPFVTLLESIDKLRTQGLRRLRYTSPHPRHFTDDLIQAHATLSTLCPAVHLPIQAGSNQVLARMNRKYTAQEYRQQVDKLRAAVPHCVLTTDIIVGFCGETDEQFEETAKLFEEGLWDQAYISRYSERTGTVADKSFPDDITPEVKAARWHRINNLLRKISLEKNLAYVGRTLEVLVENYNPLTKECEGRSFEMKPVQFPGSPELVGELVNVKIVKALNWVLKGEIIKPT